MKYCMDCGAELVMKRHEAEGTDVPYCPRCRDWRFPVFSTAVSMILTNAARDRVLLIKQYGRPFYVLCAGYVNRGEDAEDAVVREVREELGMTVTEYRFNRSRYFPPSNTLMLNFTATVREETPRPNAEVDAWSWFSLPEARNAIKPDSLAAAFLQGWLDGLRGNLTHENALELYGIM